MTCVSSPIDAGSVKPRARAPAAVSLSSRLRRSSIGITAAMVNLLARSGIRNASVREARLGERAVFRVRVGPLDDAIEADDMIERLRVAGIPDARPAHE
ncbi:MAG: hypothetical protein EB021_02000 [Gammaproteobacteria bacterium]|nr:hypothetical protein [Gammaproteobacteria bacterium]